MLLPGQWVLVKRSVEKKLGRGRNAEALKRARAYVSRRPNDEMGWLLLYETMMRTGKDPGEMVGVMRQAHNTIPESPRLANRLVSSLLLASQPEEAHHLAQHFKDVWPDDPAILQHVLTIALDSRDLPMALDAITRARGKLTIQRDPEGMTWVAYGLLLTGQEQDGEELLRELTAQPQPLPESLVILAVHTESQHPEQSERLMSSAEAYWERPGFKQFVEAVRHSLKHTLTD